jgi:uncharacterized protein
MKTGFSRALGAALLSVFSCAGAADSPDAARLAESRAIMAAMHMDRQIDAMASAMSGTFAKAFNNGATGLNPRIAEISMGESMAAMKDQAMRPGGLVDTVAQAYAVRFSLDDLRQIRAFYESSVGQRFLAATPEMMQQVMQQAVAMGREVAPRVCERVKARLAAEGIAEGATMKCPALP